VDFVYVVSEAESLMCGGFRDEGTFEPDQGEQDKSFDQGGHVSSPYKTMFSEIMS
jgi:hypothetical protein